MRIAARLVLAVASAAMLAGAGLAACFPDYGFAGGDSGAGGGDSSMAVDSTTGDSASSGDSANGDSAITGDSASAGDSAKSDGGVDGAANDGTAPSDSGSGGDTSTVVDTGVPILDGSFYDGAVPTGMTLFQPGIFHVEVYPSDNGGVWADAAVNATVTLDYAFAIDTTEVTTGAFQGWLDAGLPAPDAGASLDPGGPFATTMVWNGTWTASYVQGSSNQAYLGYAHNCDNTGGNVDATLTRGMPNLPVSCVNWFQAQAFCASKGKRLPTDAEWRVAVTSAGANLEYPWGGTTAPGSCSLVTGDVASPTNCGFPVVVGHADAGGTATVPPVFDLVGSLDEWFWDFVYPSGYTFPPSSTNFAGPTQTSQTDVQRQYFGGCYYDNGGALQNWQPGATSASGDQGYDQTGFRCAKTL